MNCTKFGFFFFFIALASLPSPQGTVDLGDGEREPLQNWLSGSSLGLSCLGPLVAGARAQRVIVITSLRQVETQGEGSGAGLAEACLGASRHTRAPLSLLARGSPAEPKQIGSSPYKLVL